jgi:hypothetical protein
MAKQLKLWNGRGQGSKYLRGTFYIAAYTQKQAAEIASIAGMGRPDRVSTNEIREYFHQGQWGNTMSHITPTEPCVYFHQHNSTPLIKLYPSLYMELNEKVNGYKTKYNEGFTQSEIDELLKDYPNINMDKFNKALHGVTAMDIEGEMVIYHCDILKALQCGIENRDLYIHEWD